MNLQNEHSQKLKAGEFAIAWYLYQQSILGRVPQKKEVIQTMEINPKNFIPFLQRLHDEDFVLGRKGMNLSPAGTAAIRHIIGGWKDSKASLHLLSATPGTLSVTLFGHARNALDGNLIWVGDLAKQSSRHGIGPSTAGRTMSLWSDYDIADRVGVVKKGDRTCSMYRIKTPYLDLIRDVRMELP